MRILFCNYEYPPLGGGGGVVMAAIARELARRHEVTVLSSRACGLPAESLEAGVRVVRVPVLFRTQLATANFPSMAAYLPTGAWRGLQLARQRPFDLINTHFVVPTGPLGHFLARRLDVPNVLSVHGGDLYDPSKASSPHRHALLRRAVAHLLRRADAVVAQSRDTAANVERIYGVRRPIERVPLGIERPPPLTKASATEAADRRATFGLPEKAIVLTTIGRVVARKASEQLPRMLAAVGRDDLYLLVVGDGPRLAAVRAIAAELGVADRIRFLGQASEAEKLRALAASDLFVSTSQHEGFGLVFLEAMAFGLPIVCYDRGGQTDFLSNPTTGSVVRLNDLEAFTAAVRELAASPQQRAAIGRNNLAAVE
ncbi:MAG TPA: glycosyltransferase, partial [Steroidobacteraceae bacterium]|nr:glycosyltransferase [Steroidobacteraceae bacterium]